MRGSECEAVKAENGIKRSVKCVSAAVQLLLLSPCVLERLQLQPRLDVQADVAASFAVCCSQDPATMGMHLHTDGWTAFGCQRCPEHPGQQTRLLEDLSPPAVIHCECQGWCTVSDGVLQCADEWILVSG